MRGQVLGVDARTGEGLVSGDDGRRYRFVQDDWAAPGEPAIGMTVDFDNREDRAISVFPLVAAYTAPPQSITTSEARTDRNKYVAALLAFVLGTLGIHRFYLGRTGSGIVMLVLTCTVVGLLLTGIWAFVDMIRYLLMSDREFASRYPRPA